eukprot:Rhum_TRINITY_DN3582_c0_g1::Rhum_TRINITY_DN3582_c0_g1_i1::g.11308::m.11308
MRREESRDKGSVTLVCPQERRREHRPKKVRRVLVPLLLAASVALCLAVAGVFFFFFSPPSLRTSTPAMAARQASAVSRPQMLPPSRSSVERTVAQGSHSALAIVDLALPHERADVLGIYSPAEPGFKRGTPTGLRTGRLAGEPWTGAVRWQAQHPSRRGVSSAPPPLPPPSPPDEDVLQKKSEETGGRGLRAEQPYGALVNDYTRGVDSGAAALLGDILDGRAMLRLSAADAGHNGGGSKSP